MNMADNDIIAAKKFKCQFHSGNCRALTTGLFVFYSRNRCARRAFCPVRFGIAHTRPQFRTKYASWRKGAHWLNACWWNRQQKL